MRLFGIGRWGVNGSCAGEDAETAYASEAALQNGSQLSTLVDTQGNAGANLRRRA